MYLAGKIHRAREYSIGKIFVTKTYCVCSINYFGPGEPGYYREKNVSRPSSRLKSGSIGLKVAVSCLISFLLTGVTAVVLPFSSILPISKVFIKRLPSRPAMIG